MGYALPTPAQYGQPQPTLQQEGYPAGATTAATGGAAPTAAAPTNSDDFLESIIPGFKSLSSNTSSIIGNLLNGTPSPSTVRNANATFGASNGLGTGSGFLAGRGYDLYNQQGQQNQQTGISDLLNTIQGFSSPTLANQGQQLQNTQFNSNLAQQGNEFDQTQQLNQFLAQLQALGLGNQITGSPTPAQPFNL